MNIIYVFRILLILSILNAAYTKRGWLYENDNIEVRKPKNYNENVYFPENTNENKFSLKHLDKDDDFERKTSGRKTSKENSSEESERGSPPRRNRNGGSSEESERRSLSRGNSNSIRNINDDRKRISSSKESERRSSSIGNFKSNKNISDDSKRKSSRGNSKQTSSSNTRLCEIKYAEYIKRIFPEELDTAQDANDSEFNGRILAAPGEYPHMTALGFPSENNKVDYKCGGSLISDNFVITAAHCTNFTGLRPTRVRIGDLNLMIEENYLEPQIRNIKKIYVHPGYTTSSYYNDIALLELEEEVDLTEFVRPIRLWTRPTLPFLLAYAMGYGSTDFAKQRTNRLTNLNMTIIPNEECNQKMPVIPETENGIITSQICASDLILNRDTCQGDSGGPLQLNIRGKRRNKRLHYHLIGITSYGLYCRSGYPSIFTRVYSYLDWIEQIVWRENSD